MMAQESWPFHDGSVGTPVREDQWSVMARQWAATGVVGAPGDTGLQVYADSSARQVFVRAGRASVRGHWLLNDAVATLTIAANTSGSPRIDRVVARLDPGADSVVLAVKAGTPSVSPAAPALTQTDLGVWELPLAQVAVANGAAVIAAGDVTDERTYSSTPATPALSTRRPSSPVVGHRIWETDTGLDLVWNGVGWVPLRVSSPAAPLSADIDLNVAAGANRWLNLYRDGVLRWRVGLADADGLGCDFMVQRFNAAGAYLNTPLSVDGGTGQVHSESIAAGGGGVPYGGRTFDIGWASPTGAWAVTATLVYPSIARHIEISLPSTTQFTAYVYDASGMVSGNIMWTAVAV